MKRAAIAALFSVIAASVFVAAQGRGVGAGPDPEGSGPGQGQEHAPIVIPDSSVEHPGERGAKAHTNHVIKGEGKPDRRPSGPTGLSPDQLRAAYALGVGGGSATIYIVDAYHYPSALADFNTFSTEFGLATQSGTNPLSSSNKVFQVMYVGTRQPQTNCGWAQEAALDIEWAHAMAPAAKIVLVEAATNSFADLFAAVDLASSQAGINEVSMSWGGSEFSGEDANDAHFQPGNPGVVFTAASGDTGGVAIYPSTSPFVIAAGGTTLNVDAKGSRISETGWSDSGGGPSRYELKPGYQNLAGLTDRRGTPDWSFDADPNTGVSVYDSTQCQGASGWMVFGGTSVSAPAIAGIVSLGGGNASGTQAELTRIYADLSDPSLYPQLFFDIVTGSAGKFSAGVGWDFVTGVGTTKSRDK